MEKYVTQSAVLFMIFNKVEETKQVFEAIRNAKPPKIYLASDGARVEKNDEKEKVEYLRKYVIENIDWNCVIRTRFSETNQGCGRGVSNAITWFFENEEMGIILEDDCLPCQFFFRFCDELLVKYKDDKRVSVIAGTNQLAGHRKETSNEYFFTRFTYIWGWATYRRVWEDYDYEHSFLPQFEKKMPYKKLLYPLRKHQVRRMRRRFRKIYKTKGNWIDTWDFQLLYLNLTKKQFCIIPKANLVSNIGFGENATHTHNPNSLDSKIPFGKLLFPLKEPDNFEKNLQFAKDFYDHVMPQRTLVQHIVRGWKKWKKTLNKIFQFS